MVLSTPEPVTTLPTPLQSKLPPKAAFALSVRICEAPECVTVPLLRKASPALVLVIVRLPEKMRLLVPVLMTPAPALMSPPMVKVPAELTVNAPLEVAPLESVMPPAMPVSVTAPLPAIGVVPPLTLIASPPPEAVPVMRSAPPLVD